MVGKNILVAMDMVQECERASAKFPALHSFHEAFGVLKEEVDEIWDEIKQKEQSHERIKAEAIQVGAMCIRLIIDLIDEPKDDCNPPRQ